MRLAEHYKDNAKIMAIKALRDWFPEISLKVAKIGVEGLFSWPPSDPSLATEVSPSCVE